MPSRRDVEIYHAMARELAGIRYSDPGKWSKISLGHKASSYFSNPTATAAFADVLNKAAPMRADGVLVHPKNIQNAKYLSNIYAGVLKAYKDAGWSILQ